MRRTWLCALALAGAACGGGGAAPVTGGSGGGGEAALAAVTLSHPDGSVAVGDTIVLGFDARDVAGESMSGLSPAFASSDDAVATVDAAGAVRGVAPGAATITATATAGGVTKSATYGVAVLGPPPAGGGALASFALSPDAVTLPVGGTAALDPVATDAAGARITPLPQLAWAMGTDGVVGISNGVVSGVAAGTTTVTASFTADGRRWSATASVTVTAATPTAPSQATVQGIDDAFSPSTVTIAAGGTVTWSMVDEEHDVTFTGAAPPGGSIPRIDRDEPVSRTFPDAGTYAYTCQRHDGDHGGTVIVQGAQDPVFTSLRVTPAAPSVAVGAAVQLTATPLDQSGAPMPGLPAATWSSADPAKATVSASGRVTGVAAGTVAVTARITHGGVTREASATVAVGGTTNPGAPSTATVTTPGDTFSPATATIRVGGSVTWQFTGGSRHNVTFTGAAPAGGNVPDTDAGGTATRRFDTAGTYPYACTRHSGMTGQVVVQP